jgi:AraC-like DNA-binding protein
MLICQSDSRFAQGYPICAKKRLDLSASAKSNHQLVCMTKVQSEGSDVRTRDLDEGIAAVTVTEIAEHTPAPVPGLIRRAERFMAENAATPITVSDVAAHLGISLRSLQAGFRQWRATTPNVFLRRVRLQLVRDELLRSNAEFNVTATALRYGFSHLGRFSGYYRATFGEMPSETLRRRRTAPIARPWSSSAGSSRNIGVSNCGQPALARDETRLRP